MNVYASRDSVAAGDDVDAPHAQKFSFPDEWPIDKVLSDICGSRYFPKISGGKATWSAVSNIPLAVIAQEWAKPRILPSIDHRIDELDQQPSGLRIHFNYHAQIDPEIVYKIFWGFRLRAQ